MNGTVEYTTGTVRSREGAMERTKHTPGPWTVRDYEGNLSIYGGPRGGTLIAEVFEDDVDNGDADARLIAAAPELLKVLKQIEERVLSSAPCKDANCSCHAALRRVREVIAKAEGK